MYTTGMKKEDKGEAKVLVVISKVKLVDVEVDSIVS